LRFEAGPDACLDCSIAGASSSVIFCFWSLGYPFCSAAGAEEAVALTLLSAAGLAEGGFTAAELVEDSICRCMVAQLRSIGEARQYEVGVDEK
jgi:hypothetical protein